MLPARDVGTYGFPGGNALVDVPAGYRKIAHYDSGHHQRRYYALARNLEAEARDWFTAGELDEIAARFEAAEAIGRTQRPASVPVAARDGADPPEEAGAQRPVRVRLDAQVEAVLRCVARRVSEHRSPGELSSLV